jgi:hypothetical protein
VIQYYLKNVEFFYILKKGITMRKETVCINGHLLQLPIEPHEEEWWEALVVLMNTQFGSEEEERLAEKAYFKKYPVPYSKDEW